MNKQRAELRSEAEMIMLSGGFASARAEHLGPFWRVCGELPDKNEHSGTTAHQVDPQDPRALARTLVALAAKPVEFEEIAEAPETVEPTFAPGEDPLDVPPEPEHDSAHEGDGETGAEAEGEELAGAADGVSGAFQHAGVGSDERQEEPVFTSDLPDTPDPIDADFSDLPELGQELAEEHPEEHASGAFIFGDNLDQKRTAAIGLVMQAAIARMPPWNDTDTARLSELRNFAMGVSEGRWNDDPGSREWLNELETRLRRRSQIVAHRDALVEFLNTASRDEVESFDPEANWP